MTTFFRSRVRDEHGFATTWIIGLVIIVLFVGMVFFQIGHVLVERQKLVAAADAAAVAGATSIDEDALINDSAATVHLSADAADRCIAYLQHSEANEASSILDMGASDCHVEGDGITMTATATGTVSLPIFALLGVGSKTLSVTSHARPTCSNDVVVESQCAP